MHNISKLLSLKKSKITNTLKLIYLNLSMSISEIIGLCGIQTIGLILILSHKKFRTPTNFALNIILVSLLVYFMYYYVYYSNNNYHFLTPYFISFTFISPPIIYIYCLTVMTRKFPSLKTIIPHLILPFLVLCYISIYYGNTYEIFSQKSFIFILTIHTLAHIVYPIFVIKKLCSFYQLKGKQLLLVFKYNKDKTIMIRVFVIMMLIHSILLTTKTIIFGLTNTYYNSLEYINIFFLLILSYVIAYHVITRPTTIHKQKKKNAIVNFKQYSKSSLNEDDAKNIALKINKYFQNEKVYLNPNISLKIVSQTLNIPSHHISETLNGLLGQSFNDFTNNYRIEEFKLLLQDKKFKNFSILALAFEVGFKSKATFNNSFKKFTKQTPSEYKKSINNNQ